MFFSKEIELFVYSSISVGWWTRWMNVVDKKVKFLVIYSIRALEVSHCFWHHHRDDRSNGCIHLPSLTCSSFFRIQDNGVEVIQSLVVGTHTSDGDENAVLLIDVLLPKEPVPIDKRVYSVDAGWRDTKRHCWYSISEEGQSVSQSVSNLLSIFQTMQASHSVVQVRNSEFGVLYSTSLVNLTGWFYRHHNVSRSINIGATHLLGVSYTSYLIKLREIIFFRIRTMPQNRDIIGTISVGGSGVLNGMTFRIWGILDDFKLQVTQRGRSFHE